MRSVKQKLKKREFETNRKIILFVVIALLLLISVGLGVLINLFLLTPSTGLAIELLVSLLPLVLSFYILHYYYRGYFVRQS